MKPTMGSRDREEPEHPQTERVPKKPERASEKVAGRQPTFRKGSLTRMAHLLRRTVKPFTWRGVAHACRADGARVHERTRRDSSFRPGEVCIRFEGVLFWNSLICLKAGENVVGVSPLNRPN
jgi:hypothetical protein